MELSTVPPELSTYQRNGWSLQIQRGNLDDGLNKVLEDWH